MGGEGRHHLGQGIWAELFLVHPDVYRVGPLFLAPVAPDWGSEVLPIYTEKQTEKRPLKSKPQMSPLLSAWCYLLFQPSHGAKQDHPDALRKLS